MNTQQKRQAAWLKSYAKSKPIWNFGGNFWGITRRRCTIIDPQTIAAMVKAKVAKRGDSGQIVML